jgi:hypothetical protein
MLYSPTCAMLLVMAFSMPRPVAVCAVAGAALYKRARHHGRFHQRPLAAVLWLVLQVRVSIRVRVCVCACVCVCVLHFKLPGFSVHGHRCTRTDGRRAAHMRITDHTTQLADLGHQWLSCL